MPEKTPSFIEAIIVVSSIFLLVAGFLVSYILYFHQRKTRFHREKKEMQRLFELELLKMQSETREETLNQLGEDLHDNIGQLLSSTKMLLGITERSLPTVPDTLRTAEETLGQAIQDIRSLSKALNRDWLDQFNVVENLEAEIRRINATQKIRAGLYHPGRDLSLGADTQLILFRIIQEALHNAIKHAEASTAAIDITFTDGHYRVVIRDDGKGFDTATPGRSGVGLLNIRRRAQLIGSDLQIDTAPGEGCTITLLIPFKSEPI